MFIEQRDQPISSSGVNATNDVSLLSNAVRAPPAVAELQRRDCRWQPALTHEARSPCRPRPASSAFKPNYSCEMGLRVEQCDD